MATCRTLPAVAACTNVAAARLLFVALVLVLHGLFGPQVAPANFATVLSWVQYRGWLIVALLAAGNFFCTGCPFVLVRDAGRRLRTPSRRWPRWLRVKWIGIALFVAVLFTYELYDLWALPRATAWLVLGYFAVALTIDLLFTGASFCKYLCPIGQFSFVASTMSPLELQVKQPDTCRTCRTVDCIKGRRDEAVPSRVRATWLRVGALPPGQGRKPRLHLLPRLCAGVPARQHRDGDAGTRARAGRSAAAVRYWLVAATT